MSCQIRPEESKLSPAKPSHCSISPRRLAKRGRSGTLTSRSARRPASLGQHGLGQEHRGPLDGGQAVVPVAALEREPPVRLAHQPCLAKQCHHPAGVQHDPGTLAAARLHAAALPSGLGTGSIVHSRIRANHQLATCSGARERFRERWPAICPPETLPSGSSICPGAILFFLSVVFMFVEVCRRQWQQWERVCRGWWDIDGPIEKKVSLFLREKMKPLGQAGATANPAGRPWRVA